MTTMLAFVTDADALDQTSRECPWCAETIKARAIVCRYCGRSVAPLQAAPPVAEHAHVTAQPEQGSPAPAVAASDYERLLAKYPDCGQLVWNASIGVAASRWAGRRFEVLDAACELVRGGTRPQQAIEQALADGTIIERAVEAPFGAPGLSSALSGWFVGVMWVAAAASAAMCVLNLWALYSFVRIFDESAAASVRRARGSTWASFHDSVVVPSSRIFGLVWVTSVILVIVWTFTAHRASQLLWNGDRNWRIGWTIGGWFIPAAQFVIPKLVMNETERIARTPRTAVRHVQPEPKLRVLGAGTFWWVSVAIGLIGLQASGALTVTASVSRQGVQAHYIVAASALALMAVGFAVGTSYILAIGRRLSPSGLLVVP